MPGENAAATGARSPAHLALGCGAASAVAAAATWGRAGVEGSLAVDTRSPAFVVAALVVGSSLALAGVASLRIAARARSLRLPHLLAWGLLVQVAAWPALPLTSRDLFSNLAYGVLQRLGLNPYLAGPRAAGPGPVVDLVSARWADTPSAYGPVLLAVSRLAAAVGDAVGSPLWGSAAAFKLVMLLCVVASLVVAWVHVRTACEPADGAERFALLAFCPLLAWELSAQAHNDALLVLAMTVFVWAAWREGALHELVAVAALAVGVASKTAAAPVLVLYLVVLARRSPPRAAVLACAAVAILVGLFAPYWTGLTVLRGPAATVGMALDRHAHSAADLLALLLEPRSATVAALSYRAWWCLSIVACAVVFLRGAWRARTVDDVAHHGLLLFVVYFITTPWFQPWYATWALPLALAEPNRSLRRIVALYGILTVAQWALPLDPVSTVVVNAWVAHAWWRSRYVGAAGPWRNWQTRQT